MVDLVPVSVAPSMAVIVPMADDDVWYRRVEDMATRKDERRSRQDQRRAKGRGSGMNSHGGSPCHRATIRDPALTPDERRIRGLIQISSNCGWKHAYTGRVSWRSA